MTRTKLLVLYSDLKELGVPYTRQHLARLEAEKKFPKRVQVGEARIAWVEDEIRAWVKARIEARKKS